MIAFDSSQFIMFRRFSNVIAQFFAFQLIFSEIMNIRFENLQVMNIAKSYLSVSDNSRMKSMIIMWNETFEISIDCKES
jgi:hypothetical protein